MAEHTLILGGARSGKSAWAERQAAEWAAAAPGREVVVIATGEARDEEMAARIALHRAQRPAGWQTVEAPLALAEALESGDPATITDPGAAAFHAFVEAVGGDRLALAAQTRAVHRGPVPLERISAPTLVLVGADDPLAARPEVLVAAIPDARLATVGGDHMGALVDPGFAPALVTHLRGG